MLVVLCLDQMGQLMQSGDLSQQVIQVLWERFTLKIPDTTPQESRAALLLISMVAGSVVDTSPVTVEIVKRKKNDISRDRHLTGQLSVDFITGSEFLSFLLSTYMYEQMRDRLATSCWIRNVC